MRTKFNGDLWTDEERARITNGLIAVHALPVVWMFDKFVRTDNGKIRYRMTQPDWTRAKVCDSFDDLMICVEGKPKIV